MLVPLTIALFTVILALGLAFVIAKRTRGQARAVLSGEHGLTPLRDKAPMGTTDWHSGESDGRPFVGGIVNAPTPDTDGERRAVLRMTVVMPVSAPEGVGSITHRGAYSKEEADRFTGLFRAGEDADRPAAGIREGMLSFADRHGRIQLWTRRKCSLFLPADLYAEATHCLVWLGPKKPSAQSFRNVTAELPRLAETVEAAR